MTEDQRYATTSTAELFVELKNICDDTGAMITTKYFGDSEMHLVSIQFGSKNDRHENSGFRFKQSGNSLKFCLFQITDRVNYWLQNNAENKPEENFNR